MQNCLSVQCLFFFFVKGFLPRGNLLFEIIHKIHFLSLVILSANLLIYLVSYRLPSYVGVEMFKKSMDFGQAGDNCGILLRGIKRDEIRRGQVIAATNTVKTYKKFKV